MPGLVPLLSGLTLRRAPLRWTRRSPPPLVTRTWSRATAGPMSGCGGELRPFLPLSSCPDLFRASTSCGVAVRAGERTRRRRDVDARTCSGHDGGRGAGGPGSESRNPRSAGNPLVLKPCARPARSKPDGSGLVPGIHVLRHRGAGGERTRRWRDVDARNKSGHDGGRGAGVPGSTLRAARSAGSGHRLRRARTCRPCPRLSPRTCSGVQSRHASRSGGQARVSGAFWTPEQVRGDNRGAEMSSLTGAEPASKI